MNPSYRWAIVAIGALMTCVALGVMFSLAVFLDPLAKDKRPEEILALRPIPFYIQYQ